MRPTRRTVCTLLGVLLFFAIFFAASGSVFATSFYSTNTSTSLGNPISNAIKLSKKAYPSGAEAVVVTNHEDWSQSAGSSVLDTLAWPRAPIRTRAP